MALDRGSVKKPFVLVQTTSVLRNPVFLDGENYNGTLNMTKTPLLQKQLGDHFAKDAAALQKAVFVPLGDKVSEALHHLAAKGLLDRGQILNGLPHPSGPNGERIAYFMGKKSPHALSAQTNPAKLDEARGQLQNWIARLSPA